MSLSLCLYVCCKHRPLYQNQIFKISITFYSARHQQSSRTVELVDHTYDGRHVARRTHTSIDRNALTALLRSRMGLLWTLFLQWFSCQMCKILKVSYYQNYCIDSSQILHSDKDHRVLIVTWVVQIYAPTNPRWRTAAILNKKLSYRRGTAQCVVSI